MDWKKILLKDFGNFRDVLMKTQPSVVDLVGSVKFAGCCWPELWWGFRVVLWIWHFPLNEFQVHPGAKHGHELKADKCNKHARVFTVRQVPMKKRREFCDCLHKSLRTLYASEIPGGQQHFYVANEKDEFHFLIHCNKYSILRNEFTQRYRTYHSLQITGELRWLLHIITMKFN